MTSMMINIPNWPKIRAAILDRDKHACRICRAEDKLHVHHIDYERTHNYESNLVTLCQPCHKAVHAENYKPYEHIGYPAPWDKTAIHDEFNQEYSW